MPVNTDHLFPDEPLDIRASYTCYPEHMVPKNLIFDQLVPAWFETAAVVDINFQDPNFKRFSFDRFLASKTLICIAGSIPSPIAVGHAVAIKIDLEKRTILYKDPYGNPAPQQVAKWLKSQFKGFTYRDCPVVQQQDHISCTWMQLANITAWLEKKDIDPYLQSNLDDFKYHILQAVRAVMPEPVDPVIGNQPAGRMRIVSFKRVSRDPVDWTCFQHLKEYRPKFRIIEPARVRFSIKLAATEPPPPR